MITGNKLAVSPGRLLGKHGQRLLYVIWLPFFHPPPKNSLICNGNPPEFFSSAAEQQSMYAQAKKLAHQCCSARVWLNGEPPRPGEYTPGMVDFCPLHFLRSVRRNWQNEYVHVRAVSECECPVYMARVTIGGILLLLYVGTHTLHTYY